MKFKVLPLFAFFFLLLGTTYANTPKLVAPEPVFQYKGIIEGENIIHNFNIQNIGKETLFIEKVKASGWGCDVISYPKELKSGGFGKIKVKVSTSGKGGKHVTRSFFIFSNDPNNKKITLKVTGKVLPFAILEPKKASLWGKKGSEIKEEILITPQNKDGFEITDIRAANGSAIEYHLEKLKDGKFKLIIKNTRKDVGVYTDYLFLRTNSKNRNTLRVNVYGNIKEWFCQKV